MLHLRNQDTQELPILKLAECTLKLIFSWIKCCEVWKTHETQLRYFVSDSTRFQLWKGKNIFGEIIRNNFYILVLFYFFLIYFFKSQSLMCLQRKILKISWKLFSFLLVVTFDFDGFVSVLLIRMSLCFVSIPSINWLVKVSHYFCVFKLHPSQCIWGQFFQNKQESCRMQAKIEKKLRN